MSQICRMVVSEASDEEIAPEAAPSLKITIITACKDNAATIDSCMASVAGQTFGNVEHLVIDCHSRDDSIDRIHAQRERLSIVYGSEKDTRFQAWNRGIGHASGDILGFVDGTDALANPDVLKSVAEAFAHPWVSAVYGDILYVHAQGVWNVLRHHHVGPFSRERLCRGWVPPTTSLFVRRSWYRRIGGFSPDLKVAADYHASLRLFSHPFFKATYLRQPVVRQRLVLPKLQQLRTSLRTPLEELNALRTSKVGGWQALAWRNASKLGKWL